MPENAAEAQLVLPPKKPSKREPMEKFRSIATPHVVRASGSLKLPAPQRLTSVLGWPEAS